MSKRFVGYFVAQLLGTFNDNLFRNVLIAALVYRSVTLGALSTQATIALSAALFITPFFAFSPVAGQLADKVSKSALIRRVKLVEVLVVGLAAIGFWLDVLPLLLGALFLMGVQSTLFETVRLSVLPELLLKRELIGGNGLVAASTFLAILLGTIAGGVLGDGWIELVPPIAFAAAVLGLVSSLTIPPTAPANPTLRLTLNPLTATSDVFRALRSNRTVFLSALGISWLWFLGGSFLALLPSLGSDMLGGDERLIALFLSVFCIGVAVGSLLCQPLGRGKLELGLVPLGSIGLTIATLDLYFASEAFLRLAESSLSVDAFVATPGARRVLLDFFLLAMFGGFFTVPLYALIQDRSSPENRSRVIAGSNILSALALTLSSLMLLALPALGVTIPETFLILAAISSAVFVYIYSIIPEFLLRLVAWLLANLLYRIRVTGREHLPDEGPAIIAANHVTYIDWLVISSVYQRPMRFVMHESFISLPLVGWAFRDAKVIPIASRRENPEALGDAFRRIGEELDDGNVVCIFPEGELTRDGKLGVLKPGVLKMLETHPVPVVPVRLDGFWGSFFSRKDGLALRKPFRRFWSRVTLTIFPPQAPTEVTLEGLEARLGSEEPRATL
ncbi:MAG: MFS transporter [Polyangiales bacterium]